MDRPWALRDEPLTSLSYPTSGSPLPVDRGSPAYLATVEKIKRMDRQRYRHGTSLTSTAPAPPASPLSISWTDSPFGSLYRKSPYSHEPLRSSLYHLAPPPQMARFTRGPLMQPPEPIGTIGTIGFEHLDNIQEFAQGGIKDIATATTSPSVRYSTPSRPPWASAQPLSSHLPPVGSRPCEALKHTPELPIRESDVSATSPCGKSSVRCTQDIGEHQTRDAGILDRRMDSIGDASATSAFGSQRVGQRVLPSLWRYLSTSLRLIHASSRATCHGLVQRCTWLLLLRMLIMPLALGFAWQVGILAFFGPVTSFCMRGLYGLFGLPIRTDDCYIAVAAERNMTQLGSRIVAGRDNGSLYEIYGTLCQWTPWSRARALGTYDHMGFLGTRVLNLVLDNSTSPSQPFSTPVVDGFRNHRYQHSPQDQSHTGTTTGTAADSAADVPVGVSFREALHSLSASARSLNASYARLSDGSRDQITVLEYRIRHLGGRISFMRNGCHLRCLAYRIYALDEFSACLMSSWARVFKRGKLWWQCALAGSGAYHRVREADSQSRQADPFMLQSCDPGREILQVIQELLQLQQEAESELQSIDRLLVEMNPVRQSRDASTGLLETKVHILGRDYQKHGESSAPKDTAQLHDHEDGKEEATETRRNARATIEFAYVLGSAAESHLRGGGPALDDVGRTCTDDQGQSGQTGFSVSPSWTEDLRLLQQRFSSAILTPPGWPTWAIQLASPLTINGDDANDGVAELSSILNAAWLSWERILRDEIGQLDDSEEA